MSDQQRASHLARAESCIRAGNVPAALKAFRRAVEFAPDDAKAHFGLASAYSALNDFEAASAAYAKVISLRPDVAAAHFNKANMDRALGLSVLAIEGYREAVRLDPQAVYFNNLGTLLADEQQHDAAISALEKAIELDPKLASAQVNLARTFHDLKRWKSAIVAARRAVALAPEATPPLRILARALKETGPFEDAITCLEQAVSIDPTDLALRTELAGLLRNCARLREAIEQHHIALRHHPEHAKTHSNLAEALRAAGQCEDAINHQRRALELDPTLSETHSNLLLTMLYQPQFTPAQLLQEARDWAAQHSQPLDRLPAVPRKESERLRIGYISGNFHDHPVGLFLEPVVRCHDHERFEIHCYANQEVVDDRTRRIRDEVDHWSFVTDDNDAELAERIQRDGIDILVDLSGHTSGNRLLALARKPAPIQVGWAAYSGSTGLSECDYILADRWVIPRDEEQFYVERIERLPDHYVCFDVPTESMPACETLEHNAAFMFGCFNNRAKITSEVVEVWSRILSKATHAHLFLKTASLSDESVRDYLLEEFAKHGVAGDRLRLEDHAPRPEFLAAYRQVDLCLDPFPFNGGVTTIESLWMGVPVLTVKGDRFVAHASETFLRAVGLETFVAKSLDEYIYQACELANDRSALVEQRVALRQRLLASPLCNYQQFTQNLELAYQGMWSRYQAGGS